MIHRQIVVDKWTREINEQANEEESLIDKTIGKAEPPFPITFETDSISQVVLAELKKRYEKAEWVFEAESDGDGILITLN